LVEGVAGIAVDGLPWPELPRRNDLWDMSMAGWRWHHHEATVADVFTFSGGQVRMKAYADPVRAPADDS